jgi:DNA-binding beta-propeller fold protein YncE
MEVEMKHLRLVLTFPLAFVLLAMPAAEVSAADTEAIELLGSFETLQSLGFTPDGISYSPQGGRLMIAASADSGVGARGVFEVTQDGRLIDPFSLPELTTGLLGFSIERVSSGPKVGHFFMVEFNGLPNVTVYEFDASLAVVNSFPLNGSASPGDGIAFNHLTQHLLIADGGSNELIEVTTSGDLVRVIPTVHAAGLAFNQATGTYFGVSGGLFELSADGELLRTFDLTVFGVKNAVGIAYGQGKLFIADEGDPPNSGGAIYIFKSPHRRQ